MLISTGVGYYAGNERHVVFLPHGYRSSDPTPGVIYCHGAGQDARVAHGVDAGSTAGTPSQKILMAAIGEQFPTIVCDLGGLTWGNDTAVARIDAARSWLGRYGPTRTLLVGNSMGGLNALNWARVRPTLTAGVVGIEPVSDLTDLHANDRGGNRASIDSAYAGGYVGATYGPTHNPATFAGSLAGMKYAAWYGTADTIVIPSTVTGVAAAIGGTATALPGQVHGEALVGSVPIPDVLAFLRSCP